MSSFTVLAFAGVGLEVLVVASVTLAILLVALLAASAYSFFRSVGDFENEVREATMDLSPAMRRSFYAHFAALHPKNAAVAWFLAVGLGPIGANLYRGKWLAFAAAVVTLNGLGAWWLESIFTTPYLVLVENRSLIAYALELAHAEANEAPIGFGRAIAPMARLEAVAAR